MSRTLAQALLGLLLGAFAAAPAAATKLPGDWIEARSAHFVVLGNVTEKKAREVAEEFERIRAFFALRIPGVVAADDPPLWIYVARDDATMKILMPSLLRELGAGSVGGRFVVRPTAQFIQLQAGTGEKWDLQLVFHEYFHYLSDRLDLDLPLWLEEGLADFWGATQFTRDAVEIGRLLPTYMKAVGGLELERLLVLDRTSPEYRDPARRGIVYAGSWALVHYLVLGEKGARSSQLPRYIDLVRTGRDSLTAAKEAFGELAELDRGLSRYRAATIYPLGKIPPAAAAPPLEVALRKVGDGEAAARIVVAQFATEPTAEMARWVTLAREQAPAAAATDLATGLLALREQRLPEAESGFARAANAPAQDEQMAIAWYGLAVLEMNRDSSPSGLTRAENRLQRAVDLDPRFAAAHSRLAEIYLRQGDPRRALSPLRVARRLRPDDDFLDLVEIHCLERLGSHAAAEIWLTRIVADALRSESAPYLNNLCWHGTLLGYASYFLRVCDQGIESSPASGTILDSRGVARGLTGDTVGAAADFRAALAAKESSFTDAERELRRSWLDVLGQGGNPFTPALLQDLLYGPLSGLRWGR